MYPSNVTRCHATRGCWLIGQKIKFSISIISKDLNLKIALGYEGLRQYRYGIAFEALQTRCLVSVYNIFIVHDRQCQQICLQYVRVPTVWADTVKLTCLSIQWVSYINNANSERQRHILGFASNYSEFSYILLLIAKQFTIHGYDNF